MLNAGRDETEQETTREAGQALPEQTASGSDGGQAQDGRKPLHIVGIGASAGGLEALEHFFSHMPPKSGLAFVVIQHLSPDFKSLMDEILSRQTTMAIHRVEDGMELQPDSIYLIPPKKEMSVLGGRLFLSDKEPSRPLEMPIDIFFRALAHEAGERAIGVILSGTGTDGSRGIGAIHEAGGLVLVQSPETAQFDGMPRSAIDTGMTNFMLAPREMPEVILQYLNDPNDFRRSDRQTLLDGQTVDEESAMALALLKRHYGIDFAYYKPTTVGRRLSRRMAMRQISRLSDYLDFLSTNTEELNDLYKDLLIGVTSFFRDPEAFGKMEREIIPAIFDAAGDREDIRAWTAGCATGEEAYSLAILLYEEARRRQHRGKITIFATDVHRESLEFASVGLYDQSRFNGMSSDRMSRFFREENGQRYRVCPELRSMVVFAPHNVIADPPFTKMDLVSCRNMLIYLLPVAQEKAISLFHFALKVGGVLFMGSSESPGALASEFDVLDSKTKIFRKMRDVKLNLDLRLASASDKFRRVNPTATATAAMDRNLLRDYDILLKKHLPTGLIVGDRREVLHFFGDVSRYLTNMAGRAERDVIDMAGGDLKLALGAALHRAAAENARIVFKHVKVSNRDGHELIDLTVECLADDKPGQKHYHVAFTPSTPMPLPLAEQALEASATPFLATDEAWRRIAELEGELQTTRENLQATIEELQTTNEELQATNEEMLAANEELQSTNEELHSVNEELYTVNAEFEKKNKELRELNEDHENLLRSTEVGTLFLDCNLCIRKFNPAITRSFKLMPHDVGRPVDHIAYQFSGQEEMLKDLRDVLTNGTKVEREIHAADNEWLLQRILPFKSNSGIKGVVLTFTDITRIKAIEAERYQAQLIKELASNVPGMVCQFATPPEGPGRFTFVSDGARELLGEDLASRLSAATSLLDMVHEEDVDTFELAMENAVTNRGILDCEHRIRHCGANCTWLHTRGTPKQLPDGTIFWSVVSLDATDRRRTAHELELARTKAEDASRTKSEFLANMSHEIRTPLNGVLGMLQLLHGSDIDQDQHSYVRISMESGVSLLRLIDDILDLSKIESGKIEIVPEQFDLRRLFETACAPYMATAAQNGLTLSSSFTPDRESIVVADSGRIRQILNNLIANAIKFTPAGEVSVSMELYPGRDALGRAKLSIHVRDTGIGIQEDKQAVVFDEFTQVDGSYQRIYSGAGLGLSIVKKLTAIMGGAVALHSELGKGTSITVELMVQTPEAVERKIAPEPHKALKDVDMTALEILVVEDDPVSQFVARKLLERLNATVHVADSGERALEMLRNRTFNLVLMDGQMPGMDGIETTRILRSDPALSLNREVPVIALTAHAMKGDKERFLEAGMNGYVTKPLDMNKLKEAIVSCLAGQAGE